MRVLLTADVHYNHPRSKPLARDLIDQMNQVGGDVLVVVGDTAVADGDSLEQCLLLVDFKGPKLIIAGNPELWTRSGESYAIYTTQLPARVRALGWHWLEADPFVAGDIAIVGSVGWYDYSFAQANLGIPLRFYRRKVSPGAAARLSEEYAELLTDTGDVPAHAMEIVARWNDGGHVTLGRSDEEVLDELLARLDQQLASLAHAKTIVAAIHHLPFKELLPPSHMAQWDFAKAYLGSDALGKCLISYPNVRHAYCGHSHFPCEATIGHVHAINIGSGYRIKAFKTLEL
jgi:predicted phosphohydrolase